jgi:2-polyprenyl-3-methyl-5-hydroxy-6-metoxy-1,4-benzoquinol methylase
MGLAYQATDLAAGPGVDFIANFETGDGLQEVLEAGPFGTVLVLNVLEHVFDPIAVLDNALAVTSPGGGTCRAHTGRLAYSQFPDRLLSPFARLVSSVRFDAIGYSPGRNV